MTTNTDCIEVRKEENGNNDTDNAKDDGDNCKEKSDYLLQAVALRHLFRDASDFPN